MRPLVAILSCAAVLAILLDAFETIILPRRVIRRVRFTVLFYRLTWPPWSALASRIRKPRKRENVLSYYGPFSTIALLVFWAFGMMLSFAALHWALATPLIAPEKKVDFWTYLYMSGTTYFTLGLGDVIPPRRWAGPSPSSRRGPGFCVPRHRDRLSSGTLPGLLPARGDHLAPGCARGLAPERLELLRRHGPRARRCST